MCYVSKQCQILDYRFSEYLWDQVTVLTYGVFLSYENALLK